MTIQLAVSTSTSHGSICLHDGKQVIHHKSWHREQSHAEILNPVIDEALKESNLHIKDIQFLSCDIGPGSFTGVRIGVSTVKTLAYANQIPIAAVTSLHLMASAQNTTSPILVILNAQRQEVYGAYYKPTTNGLTEVIAPKLMSLETLEKLLTEPILVVGDGYDLLKEHFSPQAQKNALRDMDFADYPSALILAKMGLEIKKLNRTLEWKLLEPLYIRLSAAEEKLAKGELKRHV